MNADNNRYAISRTPRYRRLDRVDRRGRRDRRALPTVTVAAASLVAMLTLSWRQLRLYWVGGLRATLFGSLGFAVIGLTTVQWVAERPFNAGFWLVHALDAVGVLAATTAVAFGLSTR